MAEVPVVGGRWTSVVVVGTLAAACASGPAPAEDVTTLFERAGGQEWCGTELRVTLAPWVGTCGDPATDGRVLLGVSFGGDEIRASIDLARRTLASDAQLLLVPDDPEQEVGFQLRSRDRTRLEEAQVVLGGTILDTEAAIDEWLAR